MTKVHTNLYVEKISLVSKEKNPAVPSANVKYAVFKTVEKTAESQIERVEKSLNNWKIDDALSKLNLVR